VDRAARVARFQADAACPLFLISLKAGGVGLNLTAAEYVFLLDPWWNPRWRCRRSIARIASHRPAEAGVCVSHCRPPSRLSTHPCWRRCLSNELRFTER
jgi:hypothetical protein